MNILVINGGSSSLKYQLFDMETRTVQAKGQCERIGLDGHMKHTAPGKPTYEEDLPLPDHAVAIKHVVDKLTDPVYGVISDMKEIDAVGHRIVHGGSYFTETVLVDEEVTNKIEEITPFAPLHQPGHVMGIRGCRAVMGDEVPMTVVFDTAFHATIPAENHVFAINYEYYEKYKVRRYGFHGTSHRYVSGRCAELLGKKPEDCNIVVCHLGNGSSICAVKGGKSYNTSMGFGPLDGLPMGTRSGLIDATAVDYLCKVLNKDVSEFVTELNKKSGFAGICGMADFRDITAAAEAGDEKAQLAREMLVHSIIRFVAGYAVEMGSLDAVVFTAGIGENTQWVREKVCEGLAMLGVKIDLEKNNCRGKEIDLSTEDATVRTFIIPTNEELMIAIDTERIVKEMKK
ncbi:MAG: acetate kinase [Clostridia bacterium]|nr:acetate kinase [Oscillospiraceae bacterium]MBR6747773.1 acetate kinase [Clostridia bacterium]